MKLKVCGMKYNTAEVAKLQPDYLGFIFYEKSSRDFEGEIPETPSSIKKVGVFVDAELSEVIKKIEYYGLTVIQLHGKETPEYCQKLKSSIHPGTSDTPVTIEIIKVLSIRDKFDFSVLKPYEAYVDYFLFDTKGKLPGGNGYTFNWNVLKDYPSAKPYFLSGGIGLDEIDKLKSFINSEVSKHCYAIDVNSKFEKKPGLKNIEELEKFKNELQH